MIEYMKAVWKAMAPRPTKKLKSMCFMSYFVQKLKPCCGLAKIIIQMQSMKPVRPSFSSTFLVMQLTQSTTMPKMNNTITLNVN